MKERRRKGFSLNKKIKRRELTQLKSQKKVNMFVGSVGVQRQKTKLNLVQIMTSIL